MAVAASQAGDADSSRAPGLTSGLQGSVNVHRGTHVGATVTVHQFFCILYLIHTITFYFALYLKTKMFVRTAQ